MQITEKCAQDIILNIMILFPFNHFFLFSECPLAIVIFRKVDLQLKLVILMENEVA